MRRSALGLILLAQVLFSFQGLGAPWLRGHNGWNSAAYLLSARNSLRWGLLFPLQYYTGLTPPDPAAVYTHHPLGMHLHNLASVWLFGDHPAAIRGVAGVHALFAALALFWVVRRFWSETHAVIALGLYVLFPINAIYANMANHIAGYIAWGLLTLGLYLQFHRAREALVARAAPQHATGPTGWGALARMAGAYTMSALWDWPANYLALAIALHWFAASLRRNVRSGRRWVSPSSEWLALAGYCALVLGLVGGHFWLAARATGGVDELLGVVRARANAPVSSEAYLRTIPELMFTWPVLALGAAWALAFLVRVPLGRVRDRDLIPVAFGCGGLVHYLAFKWSAVVHSFWGWHVLPFLAIALSTSLVAVSRTIYTNVRQAWVDRAARPSLARAGASLAAVSLWILLIPLVARAAWIIPDGRAVGGSMWWVAPIRGPVQSYHSGVDELRFASKVRAWTTRQTGVLVHRGFDRTVPEPRWTTTLDRETRRVHTVPSRPPSVREPMEGWVLVGLLGDLPNARAAELASRYRFIVYDRYFMVDFRQPGVDVRVWTLETQPMTCAHWFWVSTRIPPVREVRSAERERALLREISI